MTEPADIQSRTIAVTGGAGFIGGHLLPRLADAGWDIRALTRRAQPPLANVTWIDGDLANAAALADLVGGADAILHLAGLVKARDRAEFFAANAAGTANLIAAAERSAPAARFILVTSLAAREPLLSDYAASKRRAEQYLEQSRLPHWGIVRPPAVYGPGDRETLKLFQAAKTGVLPRFGGRNHRFSMIHAADLADLLARLADSLPHRLLIEPDDGQPGGYSLDDVAALLAMVNPRLLRLPVPGPVLHLLAAANYGAARLGGRATILSPGKARELLHPDWVCRAGEQTERIGWQPKIGLAQGLRETLDWYRAEKWL